MLFAKKFFGKSLCISFYIGVGKSVTKWGINWSI